MTFPMPTFMPVAVEVPFEPVLVLNDTDESGLTTYEFTTDPLGYDGAPKRLVILATLQAGGGSARSLVSATIGGSAATVNVTTPGTASNGGLAICSREVTTGSAVTVTLTWSDAGTAGGAFGFILGQAASSPTGVGENQVTGTDTTITTTCNTPAGGALFMAVCKANTNAPTWNVGSQVATHTLPTNTRYDVGIWQPTTAQSPQSVAPTWSGSVASRKVVAASWAPAS